jgi:PIN domain nuclease of toxin-antitoxin system
MRLLIDTHLLLWAADEPERLPARAMALMGDGANTLIFSAVNIWEIVVKQALKRSDFVADPVALRRHFLESGYEELPVTSLHTLELGRLPLIHRDPFDRLLIAQAIAEGASLVSADGLVARYPGPILKV